MGGTVGEGYALPVAQVATDLIGEGPAAGRPATFLLFGTACTDAPDDCPWCDHRTLPDDDRASRGPAPAMDVAAIVHAVTAPTAVLAGAEPLLHQQNPAWVDLLRALQRRRIRVHLETNGTRAPTTVTVHDVDLTVVSPRLSQPAEFSPDALRGWAERAESGRVALKLRVRTEGDCDSAVRLATWLGWAPEHLWLMPVGSTPDELADRWPIVARYAADHGVNATHRLHVLAAPTQRRSA